MRTPGPNSADRKKRNEKSVNVLDMMPPSIFDAIEGGGTAECG
jgi:hypothetical protein